jgi:hypothetical protein
MNYQFYMINRGPGRPDPLQSPSPNPGPRANEAHVNIFISNFGPEYRGFRVSHNGAPIHASRAHLGEGS